MFSPAIRTAPRVRDEARVPSRRRLRTRRRCRAGCCCEKPAPSGASGRRGQAHDGGELERDVRPRDDAEQSPEHHRRGRHPESNGRSRTDGEHRPRSAGRRGPAAPQRSRWSAPSETEVSRRSWLGHRDGCRTERRATRSRQAPRRSRREPRSPSPGAESARRAQSPSRAPGAGQSVLTDGNVCSPAHLPLASRHSMRPSMVRVPRLDADQHVLGRAFDEGVVTEPGDDDGLEIRGVGTAGARRVLEPDGQRRCAGFASGQRQQR